MDTFRVQVLVESDGSREDDLEIEKVVEAHDCSDALDRTRELIAMKNPETNPSKIWFWSIESELQ